MSDLGDALPFSAKLYSAPPDQGGTLVNALSAVLTITLPDGTALTPSIPDPVADGIYQYNYSSTMAGRHVGRWLFTFFGGTTTAYVEMFDVRPADPGYLLSLSDAKRALNIPATSTGDDEELLAMVGAVTAIVEDYRKEAVVRRVTVERIVTSSTRTLLLKTSPIISVTSVVCGDVTRTTGFIVDADLGEIISSGEPFSGDLTVTYIAGRSVIPANFTEAAKIILKHLWSVQQTAGMGSKVMGVGGDDVSYGIASLGFALPNRAAELLGGRGVICA